MSNFSLITNTLAKDKRIEDDWRGHSDARPQPLRGRRSGRGVGDSGLEKLRETRTARAMKAKWFDVDKLDYWDRNAPLPHEESRKFSWKKPKRRCLTLSVASCGSAISPRYSSTKIGSTRRETGEDGAFAHPTVPKAHPFVLMNFHGKARDVNARSRARPRRASGAVVGAGELMADTPLTLETASVFSEMLTFRAMLDAEPDPKENVSFWRQGRRHDEYGD